jgi:2-polyprenyl-3-methyl-5-hydroxy-6-metoxy-1,4-benzoquinol methylase
MTSGVTDPPEIPVELEESSCPIGCHEGQDIVFTGHDRISGIPGEYPVVRCRGCGLMRTSPRPTPDTIGFYYPADYGPYVGTSVAASAPQGSGLMRLARRLFDLKAHSTPPLPPGRMLEIGCASGSYLRDMLAQGWDAEGIEFSPVAAAAARESGLDVETGAIETLDKPAGRYDLIAGWMVLEHLHDPAGGLRKLARWAKPDGVLAFSVPDAGAAAAKLFASRWYDLHLPNHLYHFDRRNLTRLLEANGWQVERIVHQRTLGNVLGSAGYWLTDKGWSRLGRRLIDIPERGGRLTTLAFFPLAWAMAALGQTGRMTVWARRKPT